jgi:8-hydroxy-5-deazaflavin:NADPH oxidoreductase
MKIGILGAGNIGGNLGRRFAHAGHEVRFGVRDPDGLASLLEACGSNASAGDVPSAVAFGEAVVIALPWGAVMDVLAAAGDTSGKILIDANNALEWEDGPVAALSSSAAETIAARCPNARVVKAFNTLGAEHILNPVVGGVPADVFLCADDAAARDTVADLARAIGFRPLDVGPLRNARVTEAIAIAWIHLAMKSGLGRNIAFKVVGGP